MATYGYCRISTRKQDITRQERNIKAAAPEAIVYSEEYTGRKISRPVFDKLLERVKAGDTIIFDSASRMSRDAKEGFSLYERLYTAGVNLRFLNEPYIDTDTYKSTVSAVAMTGTDADIILEAVNRYLLKLAERQIEQVFAQAQKEADDLSTRTKQGLVTARNAGKHIGIEAGAVLTVAKAAPIKALIAARCRDFDGTDTDADTMIYLAGATVTYKDSRGKERETSAKLSRNTYYKYKAEIAAEREKK